MNSGKKQYFIYGLHAVQAALKNPKRTCLALYYTQKTLAPEIQKAVHGLKNLKFEQVDISFLKKRFGEDAAHQGVALLVTSLPEKYLEDLFEREKDQSIVLVLDQITDPHNVGAITRSAAAFGADALILQDRHAPSEDSAVLTKIASGGIEHVPLIRVTNLARTLDRLKKENYWCIGLDERGEQTLGAAASPGKTALVLGAEGQGLRRLTRESCDLLVRLPTTAHFATLNVSNAAAIGLYELHTAKG